jgi:hypothetical protein
VVSHSSDTRDVEMLVGPMFKVACLTPREVGEAVIVAGRAAFKGLKVPDVG